MNNSTPTQPDWSEKIKNRDFYEETGIYHVDGAEYNVEEDKLITFIQSVADTSFLVMHFFNLHINDIM